MRFNIRLKHLFNQRPKFLDQCRALNKFSDFLHLDVNKCRWQTENDSCDDYVTEPDVTFSGRH